MLYWWYTDILLDDFLVAENSQFQSGSNVPVSQSEKVSAVTSPTSKFSNLLQHSPNLDSDESADGVSFGSLRFHSFTCLSFLKLNAQ